MTVERNCELVDTCVFIDLLDIPFEAEDRDARRAELKARTERGVGLYLPVAAIVETGQHIQRIDDGKHRRRCAQVFEKFLRMAIEGTAPWQFTPLEWNQRFIEILLTQTPGPTHSLVEGLATRSIEMGDLTILAELRTLRANLIHVRFGVWTRDHALAAAVAAL